MSDENSPVHTYSGSTTRWSRVNFAEAIQGVQTPLGWSFWEHAMERALRQAFGSIGALTRAEVPPPASRDLRTCGAYYGQATGNVTLFHRIGEALPGVTGDSVIEQMYGERESLAAESRLPVKWAALRYPLVAVKMPTATVRASRAVGGLRQGHRTWWRHAVIDRPPDDIAEATALLRESADRFVAAGVVHTVISMVGQSIVAQVESLAEKAWGSREQAADLMTGFGNLEEAGIMGDIWSVAHGQLPFEEFLNQHGYHGPDEGALTSTVWRENPTPARRLVDRYRSSDVDHPRTRETAQVRKREEAEQRLYAALGRLGRPKAKLILKMAKSVVPKREVGKAAFLHALDGGRCAARVIGTCLHRDGLIADVEDVFFLTYEELLAGVGSPVHDLVAERRADHVRYRAMVVPYAWTGNPVPLKTAPVEDEAPIGPVTEIDGIGVVGTEITGRARVMLDPSEADLEPGDILVCRTTDPSWTPLFLVADALVIDTGGVFSHGAIVARELGVTCVINTKTGTRDIPDGATITVDGRTGKVTIAGPAA